MFTVLSNRFQEIFSSLRGEIRLTPEVVDQSLREIRLALLEADVNFKVVRAFIERVRERTADKAVLASLTPSQQVISIVRTELLNLLGEDGSNLFNKKKTNSSYFDGWASGIWKNHHDGQTWKMVS